LETFIAITIKTYWLSITLVTSSWSDG